MSSAHHSLQQVVNAILMNKEALIKFPTSDAEFKELADKFYAYKYANVVGAIDGSSIEVTVPDENRLDYFTRKYVTAVNLTAVCDSEKRILDINVGHSGRCHDAHIYQCSGLARRTENGLIPRQFHIIG
jgi:hypothetical protein